MVLDVVFVPILTELWPWEGPKLKIGKCSNWICLWKILLLFLALFFIKIIKIVLKNCLFIFLRFLAFQNYPWSSKYDKIHGSDSKFKFFFKTKAFIYGWFEPFSPYFWQKKILSFGPLQGYNSVNIGTKTASRIIFGN